jgi:hypothetical protein
MDSRRIVNTPVEPKGFLQRGAAHRFRRRGVARKPEGFSTLSPWHGSALGSTKNQYRAVALTVGHSSSILAWRLVQYWDSFAPMAFVSRRRNRRTP